ncbi:TlpA disulfide reductase family protein [Hymenobacter sp. UYP22]|uniref:TlpA family protein disulfide reductase n=1 Tax=Hymenobacter sp. UYP22 TaxID=3156348 RepID=UPI003390A4C3
MTMPPLFLFLFLSSSFAMSPTTRERAPDFRLQDTAGKAVQLQDFRGKVVYLDFWYSGCRPCVAEAPAAERLKKRLSGKDVVFVYISTDVVLEPWRKTIITHQLAGPTSVHLLDPEGIRAARPYHVDGFPTYMIISRQGEFIQRNAPRPSEGNAAERALLQALK